ADATLYHITTPSPPSHLFPYTTLFRSGDVLVELPQPVPGGVLAHQPGPHHRTVRIDDPLPRLTDRALVRFVVGDRPRRSVAAQRSEEHTSELQSRENLVCRRLLETKKS